MSVPRNGSLSGCTPPFLSRTRLAVANLEWPSFPGRCVPPAALPAACIRWAAPPIRSPPPSLRNVCGPERIFLVTHAAARSCGAEASPPFCSRPGVKPGESTKWRTPSARRGGLTCLRAQARRLTADLPALASEGCSSRRPINGLCSRGTLGACDPPGHGARCCGITLSQQETVNP